MNRYYQKNKFISFFNAVEDNGSLWVANSCFNGLFKMKEDGTKVEYIAPLNNSNMAMAGMSLYFKAVPHKRQIFFLPHSACDVAVFDLDKRIIKHIQIPCPTDGSGYLTAGYALYGDYLYLFSYNAKCSAIRIHLATFEMEKLSIWDEIVKNYYSANTKYIIANAIQIGDSVWMGIKNTNRILGYSLQNEDYEELESTREVDKEFGNERQKELYIVSTDGNTIECIDLKELENRSYIDLSSFIEEDNWILEILSDESVFVIVPIYGKYIIAVDRKNGNITKYQNFPQEFDSFNDNKRFFYTGKLKDKYIELFPYFSNGIIRIERQSGDIGFYRTEIECANSIDDLVLKLHYQNSIHQSVCFESVYPLRSFTDVLTGENDMKTTLDLDGENGRRIAQYILHGMR